MTFVAWEGGCPQGAVSLSYPFDCRKAAREINGTLIDFESCVAGGSFMYYHVDL